MKQLFTAFLLVFATSAFASPNEDLRIARGKGDECFSKAFMATNPTDEQNKVAENVQLEIQKVFNENKAAMEAAANAFMTVMMAHPIVMEDAVRTAHDLSKAVHPLQVTIFGGAITIVNTLTQSQRDVFNRTMHACEHDSAL